MDNDRKGLSIIFDAAQRARQSRERKMKQFLTVAVLTALLTGSTAFAYASMINPDDANNLVTATNSDSRHGDN